MRTSPIRSDEAVTFAGFDSAWVDNANSPGAICSIIYDGVFRNFEAPRLVGFSDALSHIRNLEIDCGPLLLAIDQPTIVPNLTGMRPVERAVASLISWSGGGVQPANIGKVSMFGHEAPIRRFLNDFAATEHPEMARTAVSGLHVMEVFPALALLSINPEFFGRLKGPRYNPARKKTFRLTDWHAVIDAAAKEAKRFGISDAVQWLDKLLGIEKPRKADQDCLDAVICLLIAVRWRIGLRKESIMIGDLRSGYIVAPVSDDVRNRLQTPCGMRGVPLDGM